MLVPPSTFVLAAAAALVNWRTFTASVSASPSATFSICCLPALMPFLVNFTTVSSVEDVDGYTVRPFWSSTVWPPSVALPMVTLPAFVRLMLSASLTFRAVPSASTPMFPSVRVPVAPPVTFRVSPNLMALLVPVSPAKVRPVVSTLFRVALVASLRSTL